MRRKIGWMKDGICYALIALGLIAAAIVVFNREPVDHRQCPAPFDSDYWDCDWWPKRE